MTADASEARAIIVKFLDRADGAWDYTKERLPDFPTALATKEVEEVLKVRYPDICSGYASIIKAMTAGKLYNRSALDHYVTGMRDSGGFVDEIQQTSAFAEYVVRCLKEQHPKMSSKERSQKSRQISQDINYERQFTKMQEKYAERLVPAEKSRASKRNGRFIAELLNGTNPDGIKALRDEIKKRSDLRYAKLAQQDAERNAQQDAERNTQQDETNQGDAQQDAEQDAERVDTNVQ